MTSHVLRRLALTAAEAVQACKPRLVVNQVVAPICTSPVLGGKKKCMTPLDKCKEALNKARCDLEQCKLEQQCAKLAAEKKKKKKKKNKCKPKKSKKSKKSKC